MTTKEQSDFAPLEALKAQVNACGYNVREWAAAAGLPWQLVYERLADERLLRVWEYRRLCEASERLAAKPKGKKGSGK